VHGLPALPPWELLFHQNLFLFILQNQDFDIKFKLAALQFFANVDPDISSHMRVASYRAFVASSGALGKYEETRRYLDIVFKKISAD
jgi:hypothetical protein